MKDIFNGRGYHYYYASLIVHITNFSELWGPVSNGREKYYIKH